MQVTMIPRDAGGGGGTVALATATPWQDVLAAYLDAATDSAETRRAYRRAVTEAMGALDVATLAELDGAELARYRAAVIASPLAPASKALAITALRSFLAWAGTMGAHRLTGDVLRATLRTASSTVKRPYSILTEPEIAALIGAASTPRDRAILAVLIGAGVRVSEATGLDVADVIEDADGETALHVRQGKGRKDRTVPVQPDVARAIRAYLSATGRRLTDSGPLFTAHDRAARKLPRGRLTPRAVGAVVARCAQLAGIDAKAISPHSLRHSFAVRALRHGGNVVAVSTLLGHASIVTTQKYVAHLALGELRAAIPALPGEAA